MLLQLIFMYTYKQHTSTTNHTLMLPLVLSPINPIRLLPTRARHRHTPNEAIYVCQSGPIQLIEHLADMLIVHVPLGRVRASVWIAITAVGVMRYLLVFHYGPDPLFEEMQIRHVFIACIPIFH